MVASTAAKSLELNPGLCALSPEPSFGVPNLATGQENVTARDQLLRFLQSLALSDGNGTLRDRNVQGRSQFDDTVI